MHIVTVDKRVELLAALHAAEDQPLHGRASLPGAP